MAKTAVEAPVQVAVVSPTAVVARRFLPQIAGFLPEAELSAFSLDRFVSDRRAPERIVLCPEGRSVEDDVTFLEDARRRALWTRPGDELAGAIAGLRGSHDERAGSSPPRAGRGRMTAMLLEGDVTTARAESAAASGAPRQWIVERVQNVRIPADGLEALRRLGIRWAVLEPVEVIAVVASPSLARIRSRWAPLLPARTPVRATLSTDPPRKRVRRQPDRASTSLRRRRTP